ncbi:hypothetical protein EG329_004081 [Mollisiaceae sp. DMI_Dod_QoI]|nr:hypothetical protein EG329_004081 [Helotiales sp. DMI_Dod_QoI]
MKLLIAFIVPSYITIILASPLKQSRAQAESESSTTLSFPPFPRNGQQSTPACEHRSPSYTYVTEAFRKRNEKTVETTSPTRNLYDLTNKRTPKGRSKHASPRRGRSGLRKRGLSSGAIIGIVMGATFGVFVIVVLALCLLFP